MKDLSSIVAKFKVQGTVEEIKRLRSTTHQPCHFSECGNASIQYCRCHKPYP